VRGGGGGGGGNPLPNIENIMSVMKLLEIGCCI